MNEQTFTSSVFYRDPKAALAWATQQPGMKPDDLRGLLQTWGMQDPQAALAFAKSQPEGASRAAYIAGAISGFANHDPESAAKMIGELGAGEMQNRAAADVAGSAAPTTAREAPRRSVSIATSAPP